MRLFSALGLLVAGLMILVPMGCGSHTLARRDSSVGARNQQLAAELTSKAGEFMSDDPVRAERILREALNADLYHGPAHNNLGVLFLNRGKLYLAAEEFDWARRLMPGHPDPRINLGLAFERGGKYDDALDAYASAIEVYPNHLPAVQALARCQTRHGFHDEYTDELLRVIVYRGSSEWKVWARKILATQ